MSHLSTRSRLVASLLACVAVGAVAACGYFLWMNRPQQLPVPGTPAYEEYVELFETGTASLDSGLTSQAIEKLTSAIEKVPGEPAAWANRGLGYLRQPQPDLARARADLLKAQSLAPSNADVEELLGHLAERDGKLDQATAHFQKAADSDPGNLRRLYKLVELSDRSAAPDEDRQRLVEKVLERRPTNLHLMAMRLQLACRRRDTNAITDACDRLAKLTPGWNEATHKLFDEARKEAASGKYDVADMNLLLRRLDNLFKAESGYARDMNELSPPAGQVGDALQQFVRLAPMKTDASSADLELSFATKTLTPRPGVVAKEVRWDVVQPTWLNGQDAPVVLVANGRVVRRADADGLSLAFPSGQQAVPPGIDAVLALDWNNDHATDFLLAGAGGVRFYQQEAAGKFKDITEGTKLPPAVLKGDWSGAWAVDVDMDGDLDILLAQRDGPPALLRNNGDGTFLHQPIFPGVERLRAFAWADLDNDGAADAVLLDAAGGLHFFMNERSGQFRRRPAPEGVGKCVALAVADVNDDGVFDLIALQADGKLLRISDKDKGKSWDVAELARLDRKLSFAPGTVRLQAIDLDSNGAVDLVLRTPEGGVAWLADGKGAFTALPAAVPAGVAEIVSLGEDASLDLLGLDKSGQPVAAAAKGSKEYHWQSVKPRAEKTGSGDQRINSFAIGSEVEARVGTLVAKQLVDRPAVHIGLGARAKPSLLRFVFPNGSLQYEFEKPADAVIRIEQRLKGSCPFLFTWDGKKMAFVSDFCWSTPLGLYINAQKRGGGFTETTEWIKIRGDQLVPREGYYDVRISATLWETHYLDLLSLMVVDHPPGTEVFCDERFFLTPTKPRVYVTKTPQPVARAWNHKGQDVTALVRAVDGKFLDHAGLGQYQGVTKDHWVEVDLGDDVPKQGPVYLLAHGWLQPTDSSINVALEQSSCDNPKPLSLEVPDGKGGWKVALPALGFPAGKNKIVVLRLDGIDGPGVACRFRLRTNLEIYWDALHFAVGADPAQVLQKPIKPQSAELQYRGVLKMTRASRTSPELANYEEVIHPGLQYWRDLIGYHTRFGDVKELIEKVDDRYVMMNAGDELRMRFEVPPAAPSGWKRDFVWVSDGWTKDGDLNTKYGKTVLPLPYHGMGGYDTPPGRLQDDPVYRRHPKDWETYHTRYVTPAAFERGLRSFRRESAKR